MSPRLVLLALALAGCDDLVQPPRTYAANWNGTKQLMADDCMACHGAGAHSPDAGTVPDGATENGRWQYPQMPSDVVAFGIQSGADCASYTLVCAGEPDKSLLYTLVDRSAPAATQQNADGTTSTISKMPLGTGGLPESQIAGLKAWITCGAPLDTGDTGNCADNAGNQNDTGTGT